MPPKLRKTPNAFFQVMGSLRKIAAKNIVKTGLRVPRMDESMEVVIVMAPRNVSWGRNRPRKDARAMSSISLPAILSFCPKRDAAQKRAVAPRARRVNRTMGLTVWELAMSLQKTMLNPKMA